MTAVFPARRRAEEFHAQVEGTSTPGVHDARHEEFLALVAALRDVPEATPRAEFTSALRERLVTAAEGVLTPAAPVPDDARLLLPTRRPRERRLAVAVGGLAIVGATTSMAVAAQSALPGDTLYPLKRTLENVHAVISVGEADKGATILSSAEGRLDEVDTLTRSGRLEDSPAISETLNTFTEQSTEATDLLLSDYANTGDQATLDELHAFTADSMATLTELEALVPIDARDELLHAAQVLTQIDGELQRVCPGCTPSVTDVPNILVAGGYAADVVELPTGQLTGIDSTVRAEGQASGRKGGDRKGDQGGAGTTLPETGGALSPGSVLNPGGTTGGDDPGSTGGGGVGETVDSLADSLLGTGDGGKDAGTSGGGSGDGGVLGEVDETLDDVTGSLLNP